MASSTGWRCAARLAIAPTAFVLAQGLANAASLSMTVGGPTSQPIGHYDFCKIHPAECSIRSPGNLPEHMTGKLLREITAVDV
jgi:predicted transglutaminase-like cysteine proteinase